MADNTTIPPTDQAPYVWATVIVLLIAAVFFLALLYLRPEIDALLLLGNVATAILPTIAALLAYLKAQETHLSVNSRLSDFLREHGDSKLNEGIIQGITDEQERVARQKLVAAAVASVPLSAIGPQPNAPTSGSVEVSVPLVPVAREHNAREGDKGE